MRYVVITGGMISGIGKGITSSSIGLLFKNMGYSVTMIKIDPYLNVDAGLMSPYEHGECFVLSDGGECDLDLGNYERFLNIELTREHNITTGRIYQSVIEKERGGQYLGATVQIVPHITDEIISHISRVSHIPVNDNIPDICIIEIGGTVGDMEGLPFIEALQQMKTVSNDEFCFVHVAMAINNLELKTKPIQHSIATLRSRGIFPNLLVLRSKDYIPSEIKTKLHRLCQIKPEDIISNPDATTIYHVAKCFSEQCITNRVCNYIKLYNCPEKLVLPNKEIISYYERINDLKQINLAIVGKYVGCPDTYLSLMRAIEHASFYLNINTKITWIASEDCAQTSDNLDGFDAFIIPGGFGSRGIIGKMSIARYTREKGIPVLGICLGMQIMVIDSLRKIGLNTTSREWSELPTDDDTSFAVDILPGQTDTKGGTMRLGDYTTHLSSNKLKDIYQSSTITERHRHRYEVNNAHIPEIHKSGLSISGICERNNLVEIIEDPEHKFYIGCQFHPEFKSYQNKPHPLFVNLLQTASL